MRTRASVAVLRKTLARYGYLTKLASVFPGCALTEPRTSKTPVEGAREALNASIATRWPSMWDSEPAGATRDVNEWLVGLLSQDEHLLSRVMTNASMNLLSERKLKSGKLLMPPLVDLTTTRFTGSFMDKLESAGVADFGPPSKANAFTRYVDYVRYMYILEGSQFLIDGWRQSQVSDFGLSFQSWCTLSASEQALLVDDVVTTAEKVLLSSGLSYRQIADFFSEGDHGVARLFS